MRMAEHTDITLISGSEYSGPRAGYSREAEGRASGPFRANRTPAVYRRFP